MNDTRPVSMGNWMLTMIVLSIPLVNVIMLFYWAFSSSTNPSKRTYCQAVLMFFLIIAGIIAVLLITGQIGDIVSSRK